MQKMEFKVNDMIIENMNNSNENDRMNGRMNYSPIDSNDKNKLQSGNEQSNDSNQTSTMDYNLNDLTADQVRDADSDIDRVNDSKPSCTEAVMGRRSESEAEYRSEPVVERAENVNYSRNAKANHNKRYLDELSEQNVVFSNRAFNAIISETYAKHPVETGGILLGHVLDNGFWIVTEVIPPGKNSVNEYAFFEYDADFVNYLANRVAQQYELPPRVLGLWHRHPGNMDTFSSTDDQTNFAFSHANRPFGAISGLVNIDPDLRLTLYHVMINDRSRVQYQKMNFEVGDVLIPDEFVKLKFSKSDKKPSMQDDVTADAPVRNPEPALDSTAQTQPTQKSNKVIVVIWEAILMFLLTVNILITGIDHYAFKSRFVPGMAAEKSSNQKAIPTIYSASAEAEERNASVTATSGFNVSDGLPTDGRFSPTEAYRSTPQESFVDEITADDNIRSGSPGVLNYNVGQPISAAPEANDGSLNKTDFTNSGDVQTPLAPPIQSGTPNNVLPPQD